MLVMKEEEKMLDDSDGRGSIGNMLDDAKITCPLHDSSPRLAVIIMQLRADYDDLHFPYPEVASADIRNSEFLQIARTCTRCQNQKRRDGIMGNAAGMK